ncbi:NrfD/PsrC family molybdoenzyme membrane anchor subunit [Aureibacter tunicatorum]|uniref:Molybdopterin-containing oxidoreductase family membrane subunit n=1 Tax=Aureibacter tunicatorum TaxID=866807 RepID=A0AAE3XN77_9BACT|nr:NrfD/PsrC family molybdoenzyme membrane anchor subunit [Aureibacter tunicatorum]MDR6238980.1 molybdopterin-containing oxidoreductase family membrane subunit [Aureibacter tunicatorum]BDD05094.1 molybdopterin oxidoreductase [Aureibacter tunicatorum]
MEVTSSLKESTHGSHEIITASVRQPLVTGGKSMKDVTEDVCRQVEGKPTPAWMLAFAVSLTVLGLGSYAVYRVLWDGIGMWGLNKTVGWAWDITNFVWWVGIGHAGTLISAVLLLFRQKWRTSINRAAEAMTIFAVICAAMFPVLHMGRPWLGFYWALPLPNAFGSLWVNFNSPLLWDVFAISTYFSVSLVFWYIGLIPDFATVRDRAKGAIPKAVYGALSLGWNGSAKAWMHYEAVSLILAGMATPLVLSVHTIVSFDFATSVIPGWHTTIFPPYFVAGAIFSGFAMVLTLMIITRKVYKLEDYITMTHIELMNIVIIITGSIVGIAYITEFFIAWYSGVQAEQYAFINRMTGPYWWAYWSMMTCNVFSPQLFWFKKIRRSIAATFFLSIVVNIGMWFERFVIIVTSLHRDYLPSSWAYFTPTAYDVGVYLFTFGLFFTLFFLFAKFFPVVNMAEVKSVLKSTSGTIKED